MHRLKNPVLKQLPNKLVETVVCEMTAEQKKIYKETKEKFRLGLNKKCMILIFLMNGKPDLRLAQIISVLVCVAFLGCMQYLWCFVSDFHVMYL